jgi:hypothetical protein
MPRYVNPVTQYTDSQGELLVEGFLRFEESGTNTLKPVYHDADLTIQATNPVKLDGAGRVPSLFTSGSYKVTAFKNDGVGGLGEQQWERDPVGSESGEFGADWDSATTYGINEIVLGSDGAYYESIANNNVANDPTTTPSAWSELVWFHVWNSLETYAQFDLVKGSDGIVYYSVLGSNLGNDPISDDGTNWLTAATVSTTTLKGVALKSTQAKVDAGTDDDSYVTPLQYETNIASRLAFRGVSAYSTASTSIPNLTFTAIPFDAEEFDTDNFHDNSTNNTRFTIPDGVTKVRINALLTWSTTWATGGSVLMRIEKNGAPISGASILHSTLSASTVGERTPVQQLDSGPMDCVGGDYYELTVNQGSGGSQNILGGSPISFTWMKLEVLE